MLKALKVGCIAAAFLVIYGVVGTVLKFPMHENATIALFVTMALWRANAHYKLYLYKKQHAERNKLDNVHNAGLSAGWAGFDPMSVPEYVSFLETRSKQKLMLWANFEKVQDLQAHIAEAAAVAENFMYILAVVLRNVHDHELTDMLMRMLYPGNEIENKARDAFKDALRVGSVLYGYKLPLSMLMHDDRTHLALIAALCLRQKIDYTQYARVVNEAASSEKKLHIPSQELRYVYNLPMVQARCMFYVSGGYFYKDIDGVEKKAYAPTKQHTDFLLFLYYMQDPKKNIFNGLISDLSKLTPNDYRCAMTIVFLKMLGSVPVEYAFFDALVVSSIPVSQTNPA